MRALALLVVPAALALGACATYDPYPSYSYTYPARTTTTYTYSYPAYTYSAPAVVAGSTPYFYGPSRSASRFDYDGDGVSNSADRFPTDSFRW